MVVSSAPTSALARVLRAAPPATGCGVDANNVAWPCGVVVAPIGCWATLGHAYVITTRPIGDFKPGALRGADSAQGTPYWVLALQTAMNARKYMYVHRFGIAHQNRPLAGAELVEWMGGQLFEASPGLLDTLGTGYDADKYRYVFFRM
tara:strand:+ start:2083 stop:2526 length:444 start_codon:yes stop_codon:yes gene_type:complete